MSLFFSPAEFPVFTVQLMGGKHKKKKKKNDDFSSLSLFFSMMSHEESAQAHADCTLYCSPSLNAQSSIPCVSFQQPPFPLCIPEHSPLAGNGGFLPMWEWSWHNTHAVSIAVGISEVPLQDSFVPLFTYFALTFHHHLLLKGFDLPARTGKEILGFHTNFVKIWAKSRKCPLLYYWGFHIQ